MKGRDHLPLRYSQVATLQIWLIILISRKKSNTAFQQEDHSEQYRSWPQELTTKNRKTQIEIYCQTRCQKKKEKNPHICTFKDLLGSLPLADVGALDPVNDWFICRNARDAATVFSSCLHNERFRARANFQAVAFFGGWLPQETAPQAAPRKKWP